MLTQSDTYQSFFPKLKPKSTNGKVIIPTVLNDLKSKILKIKSKLSTSQISVVQKTKSTSNFTHLATSSIHSQKKKSNLLIKGNQKKPIYSSKLIKVHSDCFESIIPNSHLRHYSTVDQNFVESSKAQHGLNRKKSDLKKGGLTERKRTKYKFETKKLKIIESPERKIVGGKGAEESSWEIGGKEVGKGGSIGKRKIILLNKLVECNESLASSISSAINERVPRYTES